LNPGNLKKIWRYKVIFVQIHALDYKYKSMDVALLVHDQQISAERDFKKLYQTTFPIVAKLVRRWNGSLQDAKDIFHDGLVLLVEKERGDAALYTSTREAYLVGICKHLWIKKFSKDVSTVALDAFEKTIDVPGDFYQTVNTYSLLKFVAATGKRCLDLLRAVYFDTSSIREAAQNLGYGSEHSLSVQKYKCLEKIREQIKHKTISYEDFLE
jgi:DNA-directed RNA polymerase specialized sigma24 family protein